MRRAVLACVVLFACGGAVQADDPTYWKDIRPVLRRHCTVCHSTKNLKEIDVSGGIALDNVAAVRDAKLMQAGKARDSLLITILSHQDENKRMPKDADPLPSETITLLRRWIDTGAKEGVRPEETSQAPSVPKTTRRKFLDVVLPTAAVPPHGVVGKGQPSRLELVLNVGPLPPVTALAFSADGNLLVSGSYGHVSVWDMNTGQPVQTLTNVLGAVNAVKFSPDGKLLAVAGGQPSARGELRLFDTATWQLKATLGGHGDVVFGVAFSPDGKKLASASFDKTVRVWDVATHKVLLTYTEHSDFVYGVAFTADGRYVISASKDKSLKRFSATTGEADVTFSGSNEDVTTVSFHPNGQRFVSGSLDGNVSLWDPSSGQRVRQTFGHRAGVHDAVFSKDGRFLATAGADGLVRLWQGDSAAPLRALTVGSSAYAVVFSPDGKRLATGSFDGIIRLWDVTTGRPLVALLAIPQEGKSSWVAVTPEGYVNFAPDLSPQWRMGAERVAADAVPALKQPAQVTQALRGQPVPAVKWSGK
jgi:WD40 repeat protein